MKWLNINSYSTVPNTRLALSSVYVNVPYFYNFQVRAFSDVKKDFVIDDNILKLANNLGINTLDLSDNENIKMFKKIFNLNNNQFSKFLSLNIEYNNINFFLFKIHNMIMLNINLYMTISKFDFNSSSINRIYTTIFFKKEDLSLVENIAELR